MKLYRNRVSLAILFPVLALLLINAAPGDTAGMFPALEGWTSKSKPVVYNPDNLYEHINGAAEIYLSYDFLELTSQGFVSSGSKSFTVDIYRHSDPRMSFGIYSQEKPRQGEFISVGSQGYYEKGVLNFLKGSHYVKISGFDLGDLDRSILENVARQVAEKLEGEPSLPKAVQAFPERGKIVNSEAFTARNYLGHSFLNFAFKADYQDNGETFQVFIIEADNEAAAAQMADDYAAFARGKGSPVETPGNARYFIFQDPYYRAQGQTHLRQQDKYVWGLFTKNPAAAEYYMNEIGKKLAES